MSANITTLLVDQWLIVMSPSTTIRSRGRRRPKNHQNMTGTAKYTVRQEDVGGQIQGRVIYYELFDGEIVQSPDTDSDVTNGVQGYSSCADLGCAERPEPRDDVVQCGYGLRGHQRRRQP